MNKQWFIAWGILFGASLLIGEYFDPKTGLYLAYGVTLVTLAQSESGYAALKWTQSIIDKGIKVNPMRPEIPPEGGGPINQ